jgi:hypothetical protein
MARVPRCPHKYTPTCPPVHGFFSLGEWLLPPHRRKRWRSNARRRRTGAKLAVMATRNNRNASSRSAKSGPGERVSLLPALHNLSGGIGGERAQAMDAGIYIIRTPALQFALRLYTIFWTQSGGVFLPRGRGGSGRAREGPEDHQALRLIGQTIQILA